MKKVTASEARRNWFRILDEVAAGATVVVERGGRRIVIRREEDADLPEEVPDYGDLIRAPDVGRADEWGWAWSAPEGELVPADSEGSIPEAEPAPDDAEED